jgi:Cu+-exporting ATPase
MSKALALWAKQLDSQNVQVVDFSESPGKGIEGTVEGDQLKLGSAFFVKKVETENALDSAVFVSVNGKVFGRFAFRNHYREQVPALMKRLRKLGYPISILSGDNAGEKEYLEQLLGKNTPILFHQKPEDKLEAIKIIQASGKKVMMVGDGLNDAGALKQADVGIAITENTATFTPASDVILEASMLPRFHQFLLLCKANKVLVWTAFIVSILYNIVGESFAVSGNLSPMVAAILMPASSLTILLISFGASNLLSWKMGLK